MSSCLFCATVCPRKFTFAGGQVKKLTVENDETPPAHPSFNFGDDSVIREQLKVIFTLKNILGVGHEQLCAFLGSSGKLNPEFWVSVCKPCEETVWKYFEVLKEVRRLEKVLDSLSNELKAKIWRSKEVEGQGPTVMLWETIRSQVLTETTNLFEEEVEDKPVISEPQSPASDDNSQSDPESQSNILEPDSEIGAETEANEEEERQPDPTDRNDDDDKSTPSTGLILRQDVSNIETGMERTSEADNLFEEDWHIEQPQVDVKTATQSSGAFIWSPLSDLESESEAASPNVTQRTDEDTGISAPSDFASLSGFLEEVPGTPKVSSSARNATKRPNLRGFVQRLAKIHKKLVEQNKKNSLAPKVAQDQNAKPRTSRTRKKPVAQTQKKVPAKMKSFACPKCSVSFTAKRNLDRHMREKHPTVRKVFSCDICNAKYALERTLLEHQELHQSNFQKRKCRYNCGKSFRYRQSLSRHEVVCRREQKGNVEK